MRFPKLLTGLAIVTLAAVGVHAAQEGLRLTAKEGDVHSYKLSADFLRASTDETQAFEAKVTGDIKRKVTKVDAATMTIQDTRSNMLMDINANQMKLEDAVVVKVLRADGTTAELRGEGAGPEAYRAATLSTVKLPDFPLAIDKSWTWDAPEDKKHGSVKAKAEYKVIGEEKLHDVDSWKISCAVTEVDGAKPASSTSTVWIGKADALLVRSESKVLNFPISGVGPVSGTQTLDLAP